MIRTAIAGILTLLAAATASAQTFPTVPAQTVIGRLGIPGDTGPSQAIPFSSLASRLGAPLNAATFGVKCDGVTDDTAKLVTAFANTPDGGTITLPSGNCLISAGSAATEIFKWTNRAINIRGQGMEGTNATCFLTKAGTPNTTDIFKIAPAANTSIAGSTFKDFCVASQNNLTGQSVFHIDSTASALSWVQDMIIDHVSMTAGASSGGVSIFYDNGNSISNSGGVFNSTVQNSVLNGGVKFLRTGDSNRFLNNLIRFSANAAFTGDQISGAGNMQIIGNNVTANGGAIIANGIGWQSPIIFGNTFEQALTNTEVNNAMIDIGGNTAGAIITHNMVVALPGTGNPKPILIGAAANTVIDNNFISTAVDMNAITDGGNKTYVGPGNNYLGPVSAAPANSTGTNPTYIARNGVNVGIGRESAPQIPLAISQNIRQALAWPAGTTAGIIGLDGTIPTLAIQANGTATFPQYLGYMSRGTAASPTATQSGDTLTAFGGGGYTGSAFAAQAYFSASAAQNWTTANRGTYATIQTTPLNSTTLTEVARFQGGFMVGTTTDPGFGIANVLTGYRINNAAATGHYLRGNGTNYVDASLSANDLVGTATSDNASAGNVGEYVEGILAAGSATALTTATGKTVTSISLTAGDWDVDAVADILPSATTSITSNAASLSLVTNTLDGAPGRFVQFPMAAVVPGSVTMTVPVAPYRFSLSATTTIFLVTSSTFTASTNFAYGIIRARRVR